MGKPDLSDYVDVNERIQEWRDKYPEGTLQSELVPSPVDGFVVVKAYAYRTPDDPRPGVGLAWEPVPGKTPYTKDSELMNAETSAWGRALIAVGAADAKKGIASQQEVRARQSEPAPPAVSAKQVAEWKLLVANLTDKDRAEVNNAFDNKPWEQAPEAAREQWLEWVKARQPEGVGA